jgi:hypothetical protein
MPLFGRQCLQQVASSDSIIVAGWILKGEFKVRSDRNELFWAVGGGLIAGLTAGASDGGVMRVVFGLASAALLIRACVVGFRLARAWRRQRP